MNVIKEICIRVGTYLDSISVNLANVYVKYMSYLCLFVVLHELFGGQAVQVT